MKLIALLFLVGSFSVQALAEKGDVFKCYADPQAGLEITVKQNTERFYKNKETVAKRCKHHSKIQFEWRGYAYFQVFINGKSLSGVVCSEDVNFEFRSSNKYNGKPVVLSMYMDEAENAKLTVEGQEHKVYCDWETPIL